MRTAACLHAGFSIAMLLLAGGTGTGCASPIDTEADDDAAIAADVAALTTTGDFFTANAIREIQGKIARQDSPIRDYYRDNLRVSACYKNPALGKKPLGLGWTETQRLFYCALPFELRICTSVKLVAFNAIPNPSGEDVDQAMHGFLKCQREVDALLPGSARQFNYSHNVNKTYQQLVFLKKGGDKDARAVRDMNISIASEDFLPRIGHWGLLKHDIDSVENEVKDFRKQGRGAAFEGYVEWGKAKLESEHVPFG